MKQNNNIQKLLDSLYHSMRNPRNTALAIVGAVICGFGIAKFTGAKSAKDKESVKTELNNYLAQQPNYTDSIKIAKEFYGTEIEQVMQNIQDGTTKGIADICQGFWDKLNPAQKKRVIEVVDKNFDSWFNATGRKVKLGKQGDPQAYGLDALSGRDSIAVIPSIYPHDTKHPASYVLPYVEMFSVRANNPKIKKGTFTNQDMEIYQAMGGDKVTAFFGSAEYYAALDKIRFDTEINQIQDLLTQRDIKTSKFKQAQKNLTQKGVKQSNTYSVNRNSGR